MPDGKESQRFRLSLTSFVSRNLPYPSLLLSRYQLYKTLAAFANTLQHQSRILDIGSGAGKVYQELFQGDSHIGVDLYERADVQGDARALPFREQCADLVLCIEVLEHIPDPLATLKEAHRVLKSGQYLILTTPLLWGEHDYADYQRWTEAGLRSMVMKSGFTILEVRRRGGIFSAVGSMFAQIPFQIFAPLREQKNWLVHILYLCCLCLALPAPWLLVIFDSLDRKKLFTTGFSILCKKVE